jgi:hypothetical protein
MKTKEKEMEQAKKSELYSRPNYKPEPSYTRPGSMDAYALPSRAFGQLRYRDGRVEKIS